jgi:hypothetical protein
MICEKCGGKTITLDSRNRSFGRWRKLKCKSCNNILETVEIPIIEYDWLKGFAKEVKQTVKYLEQFKESIEEYLTEKGGER